MTKNSTRTSNGAGDGGGNGKGVGHGYGEACDSGDGGGYGNGFGYGGGQGDGVVAFGDGCLYMRDDSAGTGNGRGEAPSYGYAEPSIVTDLNHVKHSIAANTGSALCEYLTGDPPVLGTTCLDCLASV